MVCVDVISMDCFTRYGTDVCLRVARGELPPSSISLESAVVPEQGWYDVIVNGTPVTSPLTVRPSSGSSLEFAAGASDRNNGSKAAERSLAIGVGAGAGVFQSLAAQRVGGPGGCDRKCAYVWCMLPRESSCSSLRTHSPAHHPWLQPLSTCLVT